MPRGPLVDRTAPAQRRANDPVRRLEAENGELRRKLEVLQAEKLLVEKDRNYFKREVDALRQELRENKLKSKLLKPLGDKKSARSRAITELEKVLLARYHPADLPMLFVGILRRVDKDEEGLTDLLFKEHAFKHILKQIHDRRDSQIALHLGTVYYVDLQALLRLIAGISLRRCGLFHQCFRWLNAADGTRTRAMLAPGSRQPAPQLFDPRVMAKCQRDALARLSITLEELSSEETKSVGASVSGEYTVDLVITKMIHAAQVGGCCGGMATKGTKEDPHIVMNTADGAGILQRNSGVRDSIFLASTEYLGQSEADVRNLVIWRASHKAESWETMNVHMASIRPALCRFYEDGELRPYGKPSGVFVKIMLVADLPAVRKMCGLKSHLHNCFGPPFCECCRDDMYALNFDYFMHAGHGISYKNECHRHHVPLHEALGKREPKFWEFRCDLCNKVRLPVPAPATPHVSPASSRYPLRYS